MSDIGRSAITSPVPPRGGFLVGPALAGAIKTLIDQNEKSVFSMRAPRLQTLHEEPVRRYSGGRSLRFGSFAGTWRKDFGYNLKTVTLLKPNSETNSPLFVPETTESGAVVQVTAMNLQAHIPAMDEQVQKYCTIQEVGSIKGIPSSYGSIWLLVSGEC